MLRFFRAFIPFLCLFYSVIDSVYGQKLVLQNFHSGTVKDFIINSDGTRLISSGDDKNLLFYDLTKRHIYARINTTSTSHRIAFNSNETALISLESENDQKKLVYRSIESGDSLFQVNLKKLEDSLHVRIDKDLLAVSESDKTFVLLASETGFPSSNIYFILFQLDLGTFKQLSKPIPLGKSGDQVNNFVTAGNKVYIAFAQQGIIEADLASGKNTVLWKEDKNIPSSLAIDGDNLWVLANQIFLINRHTGKTMKVHRKKEIPDSLQARNHPFASDGNGSAFYFRDIEKKAGQINENKLSVYNNEVEFDFEAGYDYRPEKIVAVASKNYVALSESSKINIFDYKNGVKILEISNAVSQLDKWNFYAPGKALASGINGNTYNIEFDKGLVSLFDLPKAGFTGEVKILKKTNYTCISNGIFIKFLNPSGDFAFGISPTNKKVVFAYEPSLENGTTLGAKEIYFCDDEKLMACVKPLSSIIQVWNISNKSILHEIDVKTLSTEEERYIKYFAYHPKENIVSAISENRGGYNREIVLVDAIKGKIIHRMMLPHSEFNMQAAFFHKKKIVFIPVSYSESIVFDIVTGNMQSLNFCGHNPIVTDDDANILFSKGDTLIKYNLPEAKFIKLGEHININGTAIDPFSHLAISFDSNDGIKVWDIHKNTELYTLLTRLPKNAEVPPSYIFISPDNYFMGGGNYSNFFVQNINNTILPFEQFERMYNRPDKIITATGIANAGLLAELEKVTLKRTTRGATILNNNFKALFIDKANFRITTNQKTAKLRLKAVGAKASLRSYQIWLNGVALHPSLGKIIVKQNELIEEDIELTEKTNRLEVAFFDTAGGESMHDFFSIDTEKQPKPSLWVVSMGVSDYKDKTHMLKYAAKDAEDLTSYLSSAQAFNKVKTMLLKDADVTKKAAAKISDFLKEAKPEDLVMLFFAGHGVLDNKSSYYLAAHDLDFANPSVNGLTVNQLENILYQTKARKKVLIIDACHSGLIEEDTGLPKTAANLPENVKEMARGTTTQNISTNSVYREILQSAFQNSDKGEGITIIAAAGGNEFAFEDAAHQNGLFTYSFLDGLKSGKADANKDKTITLSEIKSYVEKSVVELSKGKQRPTNRKWNSYFDFPLWNTSDGGMKQFLDAVAWGDTVSIVKHLKTYTINTIDTESGLAPVHIAARQNKLQNLKYLIANGADINLKSMGNSPLYFAVYNKHHASAYYLMVLGANATEKFYLGMEGPLSLREIAAKNSDHYMIELLDNIPSNKKKDSILRKLIPQLENISIENIGQIVKTDKEVVNFAIPDFGYTLLSYVIVSNRPELVKLLIENGAMVKNIPHTELAPLHIAAIVGNETIVKMLLDAGADKTEKDLKGRTPFSLIQNNKESLKALLK